MDTNEKSFMLDVHNTTTSEDILKRYMSYYKNEPPSSERGMVVEALQNVLATL